MTIVAYIYIFILKIFYFFFKLLPVKNRVLFVSRQSSKTSIDFIMLSDEIKKLNNKIDVVMVVKRVEKTGVSVFMGTFTLLKQMRYMATSKVCITDGYNIAISNLKHKKVLKIVQLWHSLGAIKMFGYQTLHTDKQKKLAKVMKLHFNYDYINGCSKFMMKHYAKAFNYDKRYLYPFGLPRIDYLINNEIKLKKEVLDFYPNLASKENILYIPTFREDDNYKIDELISAVDLDKYNLIIKVHPKMNIQVRAQKGVYLCPKFNSFNLLPVADYIITDYSGMMIESAAINKPIYLYTYDLDNYKISPGLNTNLEKEFKGVIFKDAKELFSCLDKKVYDKNIITSFKKKYVVSDKGDITNNIAMFIIRRNFENEKEN